MSKSRKKTPIISITTKSSEKMFKRYANRAYRLAARIAILRGDEIPENKLYGDPWTGPKDGKQWVGDSESLWVFLRK